MGWQKIKWNASTVVSSLLLTAAITITSLIMPSMQLTTTTTTTATTTATTTMPTMTSVTVPSVMHNKSKDSQAQKLFEKQQLQPQQQRLPDASLPALPSTPLTKFNNRFALETAELYKHLNAGMFKAFNMSLNGSYGYIDDDISCFDGQNVIVKLITIILYAAVCIIGLFGNTLVIYVVLRFSKMQTVTNIYILNLAIADECFLIGIPFLLYTMQIGSWTFGEYMCKAYMVSTSITQFTSSIFLLIMSADRYIAVCHPISSPRYRTPFVSKVVSAIAWMTSVLLMLPVILFASTVEVSREHFSCNIEWPEAQNTQSDTTFILYTLALGFATPLTFILIFYYLVIRKLHTVGPKHKSKEKKRSHRKVTKLVLTVITVYIMCWLPYWISQVALINSSPSKCASRLEIAVFLLCGCLSYSNSAMNPVLYAFLSDNFKKSFMKACTCATRKDVNAQLQLENSFFPKFGKNRQSERLVGGSGDKKSKQKKALVTRNSNGARLLHAANVTTTTATTTTTMGGLSSNTAATYAEGITFVYPALHAQPAPPTTASSGGGLLAPPGGGTNAALVVVSSAGTENTPLEASSSSDASSFMPPVLHTDL